MSKKSRHVVPNTEGGWDSKKSGAERASKHFDTKKEAEKYSRELSKKEGSELFIHGKARSTTLFGKHVTPSEV